VKIFEKKVFLKRKKKF